MMGSLEESIIDTQTKPADLPEVKKYQFLRGFF